MCAPKLPVVNRKEAVPVNEERVEPAYKDGRSKGHMIFNIQRKNGVKKDKLQGTGKQKCEYD